MSITEHFRYRNDSFQSDIFSSDIGITDIDVGRRISPILRSISMSTYVYIYLYIYIYTSIFIYGYICCRFKRKTESRSQAIFLNRLTIRSLCKRKFGICPFIYEEKMD
jgi:hypothetical protein